MPRFCVECGKKTSSDKICDDCKVNSLSFKPVKIKLCPSKKIFYKNKWVSFNNLDESLQKILSDSLNKKISLEKGLQKDVLDKTGLKKDLPVTIKLDDYYFTIPISVEVTYSPQKAKEGSEYYEGVLQIRNASMEVKDFVKNHVNKSDFFVNKLVDKGSSVDFYLTSKKEQVIIAKKIVNHFGGLIENNAKLFSKDRMTSKEIFRVNTLVILPLFKEGDVIEYSDKPVLIKSLGKTIKGFDLENAKKVSLSFKKEDYKKKPLSLKKALIIKNDPLVAIPHDNYQQITLKNPLNKKNININDKKNVVKLKEKYYLI